ncbi:intraflagellar transport-associated protein isoform X1 [Ambystoma mexicanum]|uniref:intraflagellar transport-associated protein isoform X1 n=1 Tax=Ambystoma mexicanum TaxID=8296 RepID=UPI0037E70487
MPEDSSEGCVSYGQNDIMEEDEKMQEVLNQFVNSHEQTYEEFLNTFTHLSRETKDLRGRTPDGLLVENIAPTAPLSHRNTTPTSSPPPEEDQIVIDAGRLVGGCNLDDRPLSGMFKVDNFFEADTFEADGEMDQKTAGPQLLPGEAEDDVTSYIPSFARQTELQFRTLPAVHLPSQEVQEVQRDDVEPFCLDQDFDYDRVVLTPKYTEDEMKTKTEMPLLVVPSAMDSTTNGT